MKPISPRGLVYAGLALILVTNAVVLGGVAYNRSGEPESTLKLSERELGLPWRWGLSSEKSAIALDLQWRVLHVDEEGGEGGRDFYAPSGAAKWMTPDKLKALGFEIPSTASDRASYFEHRPRMREIYLVLELDGDAYRGAVEAARRKLAKAETRAQTITGKKQDSDQVKSARRALDEELVSESRLFVVDGGLDETALRRRYPDRNQFAIVTGRVRPWRYEHAGREWIVGTVDGVNVEALNMPLQFRDVFRGMERADWNARATRPPRYEVTVAWGRRLEPWALSARRLEPGR